MVGQAIFFHGNYHEIFSTVITSLLLLQEGQLSISGKRICTGTVNCLEDEACSGKVCKLTGLT